MEFTDIDKKNMKKMYKKYGQKLVSKIIKKQDKLKMSESIRSTVRKMRKQEGGGSEKLAGLQTIANKFKETGDPDCKICDMATDKLKHDYELRRDLEVILPSYYPDDSKVKYELYDKIYWPKKYEDYEIKKDGLSYTEEYRVRQNAEKKI